MSQQKLPAVSLIAHNANVVKANGQHVKKGDPPKLP